MVKKFSMKDVDDEIIQIIEQAQKGQTVKQPPQIIQTLLQKAKAKRVEK